MGILDKLINILNGDASDKSKRKTSLSEKNIILNEEGDKLNIKLEETKSKPSFNDGKSTEAFHDEAENIQELEELTHKQIVDKLSSLSYANVKLKKLIFHFRESKGSISSIQGETLFNDSRFLTKLKAELESRDIQFVDAIEVELNFNSDKTDNFTPITKNISVEVLTPSDILLHKKARIKALSGKTIQTEYIIEAREKPYLIGRGEKPKLPSSRIIENDIAFIEPQQNEEDEDVLLNKYVSRSILMITYNKEINSFELKRTSFMFDMSHVVKINRVTGNGEEKELKLNTTQLGVPLEDNDQIIINNKVNILFELIS